MAERTPRRSALLRLGALALGSLGILGVGQGSEAKKNQNHNDCNLCKRQCRRNKQKQGTKQQRNCHDNCNTKCNNQNK